MFKEEAIQKKLIGGWEGETKKVERKAVDMAVTESQEKKSFKQEKLCFQCVNAQRSPMR